MTKIDLDQINEILSQTLIDVIERKVSIKQANTIAKLASTLSKNIVSTELKERVELLEQVFKNKR